MPWPNPHSNTPPTGPATTAVSTSSRLGWRGSGYVRWQHETNRGFFALAGLQATAAVIGESAEDERCAIFLRQLDPEWPPS